jgi:hypothetical protein
LLKYIYIYIYIYDTTHSDTRKIIEQNNFVNQSLHIIGQQLDRTEEKVDHTKSVEKSIPLAIKVDHKIYSLCSQKLPILYLAFLALLICSLILSLLAFLQGLFYRPITYPLPSYHNYFNVLQVIGQLLVQPIILHKMISYFQ